MKSGKREVRSLELLALSVWRGETKEFPWAALQASYFGSAKLLDRWAAKYRIEITRETRETGTVDSEWIRFTLSEQGR